MNCTSHDKFKLCSSLLLNKPNLYLSLLLSVIGLLMIIMAMFLTKRRKDRFTMMHLLIFDFCKLCHILALVYLNEKQSRYDVAFLHNSWTQSLLCKILTESYQIVYIASTCCFCCHTFFQFRILTSLVHKSQKNLRVLTAFLWVGILSYLLKVIITSSSYSKLCILQNVGSNQMTLGILVTIFSISLIVHSFALFLMVVTVRHIKKTNRAAGRDTQSWHHIGIQFALTWTNNLISLWGFYLSLFLQYYNSNLTITASTYIVLYVCPISTIINIYINCLKSTIQNKLHSCKTNSLRMSKTSRT